MFSATENVDDSDNNPDTLLATPEQLPSVQVENPSKPWFKINLNFSGKTAKGQHRKVDKSQDIHHNSDFLNQFHNLYENTAGIIVQF